MIVIESNKVSVQQVGMSRYRVYAHGKLVREFTAFKPAMQTFWRMHRKGK